MSWKTAGRLDEFFQRMDLLLFSRFGQQIWICIQSEHSQEHSLSVFLQETVNLNVTQCLIR